MPGSSFLRRIAGAAAFFAMPVAATAQLQVGSFVSGERPMSIYVSPLVEGKVFYMELRDVPAGARNPLIIVSDAVKPLDLTPYGVPGALGPDLASGIVDALEPTRFNTVGVVPTGTAGERYYIQGYVKIAGGGRLSCMVTGHIIAAGDDPGPDPTIVFPLPLTTNEVLTPSLAGVDRVQQPVRVGLPMPQGSVTEVAGVPQLTVLGNPTAAQFSTLAKWPDGSVKWALCEYLADLTADEVSTTWSVDHGSGNFGGADLATTSGTVTTIDTGVIRVAFDSSTPELFDSFTRGGRNVLDPTKGNRPHYWDELDLEWTWHELAVSIRRNGPVRAEVQVDGVFTRSSAVDDLDRIYVRFYVEAFRGGSSVRALTSLRATSVSFPEHLLFRGFTWRGWLDETGPMDVRMPQITASGVPTQLWSGSLATTGNDASYYQGFARTSSFELCYDPNWSNYVPFIERFDDDDFAIEGVRARIDSTYFTGSASNGYWSAETEFANPTFLEMNSSTNGHGVIVGVEHANLHWPVELQSGGDGRIEVGFLPRKDPADAYNYGLTYATAETRCFWLVAEDAPDPDPIDQAFRFDYPVSARADTHTYNQSEVWHWRLLKKAEIDSYCSHAGLKSPTPPMTELVRTVYEYSNATGPSSNSWEETRRFCQWLRGGLGGAHLNSLYEAYYKADKMPWSIDDDVLTNRQKVRNTTAFVTKKDDFYNNSKHTFLQAVHDWAFVRGETYLLDSRRSFSETLRDPLISANVQPHGNFVSGTFGAVVNASVAILSLAPDDDLEAFVHEICEQWANLVFKVDNTFGVDTATRGWQAPVGTRAGSPDNPDGYMISWDAGKASERAQYGYLTQAWTDVRLGALAYQNYVHHLRQVDPGDPLIDVLLARAADWCNYARRSIPDDYQVNTGDAFMIDVFDGDAGNPDVDPFAAPGHDVDFPDPSGYALQNIVNFALEAHGCESSFSYGVEIHRSISKNQYDAMTNDPVLNEFMWRYLVHYGLLKP